MINDLPDQRGDAGTDALPDRPDPLSPGRTDVHPSDKAGVDELPDDADPVPLDPDDEAPVDNENKVPDIDPDNAERDGVSDPR